MSTTKNADLPAMPQNNSETLCQQTGTANPLHSGLTKREYFAGLAMQGNMAVRNIPWSQCSPQYLAQMAVQMADALLAELESQKQQGGEV